MLVHQQNTTDHTLGWTGRKSLAILFSLFLIFFFGTYSTEMFGQAFSTTGNVTSNAPGNIALDKFVFGSTSLDNVIGIDDDTRLLFDKTKTAFRVGYANGTTWDEVNRGINSTGFGVNTTASGENSMVWGINTIASGQRSTAWGNGAQAQAPHATAFGWASTASGDRATSFGTTTTASGINATAWGINTIASGDRSTAFGNGTQAIGLHATAFGWASTANGERATAFGTTTNADGLNATAWGQGTLASLDRSTAFGANSQASGLNATSFGEGTQASATNATAWGINTIASGERSTAWGNGTQAQALHATAFGWASTASGDRATSFGTSTTASGNNATASGEGTFARSFVETALGLYNTDYTPVSSTNFDVSDRLLVVGNGTSTGTRSDALVLYKNGNATLAGKLTINSDRRLKTDFQVLTAALDGILQLGGYSYHWKNVAQRGEERQIGVIAQEVQALYPELVSEDGNGYLTVNYQGLVPVLIEATKEQQKLILAQQQEIEFLKAQQSSMHDSLVEIKAMLEEKPNPTQKEATRTGKD